MKKSGTERGGGVSCDFLTIELFCSVNKFWKIMP